MEELSGVQCEESKSVPEKSRGRQFKSREQLQGLEDFYTEHKYPSESLKADIAIKLNLTDKQVTVWFCHRRLKDKRLLKEESQTPGRQDFSSGVIQDHGSGLKQDSCSSTKQADCKRIDPKEVESLRFSHENLRSVKLNFPQRGGGGGYDDESLIDGSSSESNSTSQENFYPHNKSNLAVGAMEYRASNGFVQPNRGCVGPSGYLKIKGRIENAAITAVKRQLGRHYREDGPSLGIEFDMLPPEAFESPSKNMYDDAYEVPNPVDFGRHDITGIQKHSGLGTMRNEKRFEALQGINMHKSDPGKFSFCQPKQKPSFPNHSHAFLDQNSSFGTDPYSAREHKYDTPGMRSDSRSNYPSHSYSEKIVTDPKESFLPGYDPVEKIFYERERFFASLADERRNNPLPSNRIIKGDEVYDGRRPTSEHNNSSKLKMHPVNELRANKRGREEVLTGNYPVRSQNISKSGTVVKTAKRAFRSTSEF